MEIQTFLLRLSTETRELTREERRGLSETSQDIKSQIEAWRENPFNPHLIARIRIIAYMMTVVMKYLDNLIAWGDDLFRRDSIESINEATQLYLLAAEILGPKPTFLERPEQEPQSFARIKQDLDDFSNVLIDLENFSSGDIPSVVEGDSTAPTLPPMLYFCIPPNEELLEYWDTVADRLFKIRNCQNIEGRTRKLSLYEPPIDPALLVRAITAGLDIRQALRGILPGSRPNYRYPVLLQKALEFCNEVRSLGNALLSALEKKDTEALALVHSTHETELQQDILEVRIKQIEEYQKTLESLRKSKENAQKRYTFYKAYIRQVS